MTKYVVNLEATKTQIVGELDILVLKKLVGVEFPSGIVYMYPGVLKHIKKDHSADLLNYGKYIPQIIENPDYVGKNSKVPDSVELYKFIADYILLAIKLDPSGYLYLSSMYQLNNAQYKIQKRLQSGRIVPYVLS